MSEHKLNLDMDKMAQYIIQARHCLDKLEGMIQKSLLEEEVRCIEDKQEEDNGFE